MIRILCFGDSNTWGYDPETSQRFDNKTRWTQVMLSELGADYEIVEEGMNGRTTVWDDPVDGLMSGLSYLKPCLLSQKPLNIVLLMLGTNDLKDRFCVSAAEIAKSAGRLVQMIQASDAGIEGKAPEVILMAPPPTEKGIDGLGLRQNGFEKSRAFAASYSQIADELGCEFFDVGSVIESSPVDGVHFSAQSHRILGREMAKVLLKR
ncbi:SGNH/GDSL hydrolase family protein [Cocleimonas flava]|uniref:Lysophospholipase L1-like esterase n=1 Tax=Cocleimonas flava TaxID=634765 RepID=A0A4R1ETG1_9GAMM|nr:SGNH/GDSL hydrolase family protein [Cocleimonas flava]TCJ83029.1 lysophospholipase L1-like esterase [Cocleimonas flava]